MFRSVESQDLIRRKISNLSTGLWFAARSRCHSVLVPSVQWDLKVVEDVWTKRGNASDNSCTVLYCTQQLQITAQCCTVHHTQQHPAAATGARYKAGRLSQAGSPTQCNTQCGGTVCSTPVRTMSSTRGWELCVRSDQLPPCPLQSRHTPVIRH